MYEKFFSLAHRPFAAAPNLECIVAHQGYVDAREKLLRCLTDGCGMAILTAPAGLGKSLLCQDLQSRLRGMFTVAYLCSAQFPNRKAMLQAILFELGAEYLGLSEDEARLCVMKAAQDAADRGRSLIVIIDEAHLVSTELLQELRALAEPSPRCPTPARLMLAGQLELEERLADQALDSLNQRIACHAILEPLTQSESAEYLLERLAISGAKTQLFSEEALGFIVKAADGNPRALHQLADHCLLSAYTIEEKPVSLETARNSLDDLRALPLHWNDTGILDEPSDSADESLEDAGDDEFVSTVDAPILGREETEASGSAPSENLSDPGPLWGDSPDFGVIEVGGPAPEAIDPEPIPQFSEAALFASIAPWPAVPVESNGSPSENASDPDAAPADENSILKLSTEIECEEPLSECDDAEDIESELIEPEATTAEPVAADSSSGNDQELECSGTCAMETCSSCQAEQPGEENVDDSFTLHEPATTWADHEEIEECEEDAVAEPTWSRQVELLDDLEPDDFEDEEIVINDRYAALDRASQALSTWLPKAPELLQFLSQYSVKAEGRPAREPVAAMHQATSGVTRTDDVADEEELLATIRGLQQQLREAAAEQPRPRPPEPWQTAIEPPVYDIVEPPEQPAAANSIEPVREPVIEHRMDLPAPAPAVKQAEPVKSRFAQLFSRMRQRRREVEDRLRKNADWI